MTITVMNGKTIKLKEKTKIITEYNRFKEEKKDLNEEKFKNNSQSKSKIWLGKMKTTQGIKGEFNEEIKTLRETKAKTNME